MRFEGTLTQWNDDRGFGLILPTEGGQTLFAHISAFPRDGQRPRLNERLSFEVTLGQGGKTGGGYPAARGSSGVCPRSSTLGSFHVAKLFHGVLGKLLALLLVCSVLGGGYWKYESRQQQARAAAAAQEATNISAMDDTPSTPVTLAASPFRCDGRQHCSQMTSCAEAKFFLKNCPAPKWTATTMAFLANSNGVPVRSPNRLLLSLLTTIHARAGMIEGFVAPTRYAHDRLRAPP